VLPKSPRLKRGALWAELPHFVPWLVFLIMFTLPVTDGRGEGLATGVARLHRDSALRLQELIRAVCKWNRIDGRALGIQGDGFSRSAVVLETFRVKQRIGVVAAAGGAESARGVIGDVVASIDNRSRTIIDGAATGRTGR